MKSKNRIKPPQTNTICNFLVLARWNDVREELAYDFGHCLLQNKKFRNCFLGIYFISVFTFIYSRNHVKRQTWFNEMCTNLIWITIYKFYKTLYPCLCSHTILPTKFLPFTITTLLLYLTFIHISNIILSHKNWKKEEKQKIFSPLIQSLNI